MPSCEFISNEISGRPEAGECPPRPSARPAGPSVAHRRPLRRRLPPKVHASHGRVLLVVCLSLATVVSAVASLERGAAGDRARHPRDPDPAVLDRRRLRARLRGAVAASRCARRSLRPAAGPDRRPRRIRRCLSGRHDGLGRQRAHCVAGPPRSRRRARDAGHAVHHHRDVSAGAPAPGDQRLGWGSRSQCDSRPADVGHVARVLVVAVGVRAQRGAGGRRADRHRARGPRVRRQERRPARRGRRDHRRSWARRLGLRVDRGARSGLACRAHARSGSPPGW